MIVEQLLAVYQEVCSVSAKPATVTGEINEFGQSEELLANLTLRANPMKKGTYQTLASYKHNLVHLGLQPQQHNGSLVVKGNWETLLTAVKHCHQQIHGKGVEHVACTLELETFHVNSCIKDEG